MMDRPHRHLTPASLTWTEDMCKLRLLQLHLFEKINKFHAVYVLRETQMGWHCKFGI